MGPLLFSLMFRFGSFHCTCFLVINLICGNFSLLVLKRVSPDLLRLNNVSYLVKISISFFLFLRGSESSSNSSMSFPRNTSWWKSLLRWPSLSIFSPFRWSGGRISFSSFPAWLLSLEEDILAGRASTSTEWSRTQTDRETARMFLLHCFLQKAITPFEKVKVNN